MNKKYSKVQSTRRSLIMSVLSLILCFAMLIGTTWAWFTDSVTSGKNQIVAGNLDVELYHSSTGVPAKTDSEKVTGATNLFHVDLWEPGVIAYENFTVANVGNLAFKYNLKLDGWDYNTVTVGGVTHDLREVIKVATVAPSTFTVTGNAETDRAAAQALFSDNSKDYTFKTYEQTGVLYPVSNIPTGVDGASSESSFGVILYWEPTDNDNIWNINNGKTVSDGYKINGEEALWLDIGINLVATQKDYEEDSFDETYDLSAQLPATATFPSITKEKIDGNKNITIEEKGVIESAGMPAKAAETVLNEMSDGYDEADGYNNDLLLTLKVADEGSKSEKIDDESTRYIQDLDISMSAHMTTSKNNEVISSSEKEVKQLDDFATIEMQYSEAIGCDVIVKHNGVLMQQLDSADATPTDTVNGGYYYDNITGLLTIKTMTFSPFSLEYVKSTAKYVASLVYWSNELDGYDEANPELFKSVEACAAKANEVRKDGWIRMYILDSVKLTEDVAVLFPDGADVNGNYSVRIWGTDKPIEIDLNGKTFTIAETFWLRGNVTFKNGTIIQAMPGAWCDDDEGWYYSPVIMEMANSGKLVLDNATVQLDAEHLGEYISITNWDYTNDDESGSSSCVINNSTIYGTVNIDPNCSCEVTNSNVYPSGGKEAGEDDNSTREAFWNKGTLTINSGEFISNRDNITPDDGSTTIIKGGSFIANTGESSSSPKAIFETYGGTYSISVSGGTFKLMGYPNSYTYNYAPWTLFTEMHPVADGYKLTQFGGNTWQVVPE